MVSFNESQWVVVIGLLFITFIAAWTMSMHFERAREVRRKMELEASRKKNEEVEDLLEKKRRRRIDHEINTLGQLANLIAKVKVSRLSTESWPSDGKLAGKSHIRLIYKGTLACKIFCDAELKKLIVLDQVVGGMSECDIDQAPRAVDLALQKLSDWDYLL